MKTKKCGLLFWIVLCTTVSGHAHANKFYGSASIISEESNNALKTTDDQIKERQDQFNLSLGGELSNSLIDFNAEYSASARNYAKKTQEDNNPLEGKSMLLIGKHNQPADLLIEHSRITVLKKPDATNLTENQDERDITSVTPTIRGRISPVDNIYLKGKITEVNYAENENKNSRRDGGTLGLEHNISTTDNMHFLVQQTNIEFENAPLENYVYRSAEVTYSTKLRQLSYILQAGANESMPENEEKTVRPKYSLELKFNSGTQTFSLSLLQELTDASLGGGNKLTEGKHSLENDSTHNLDRFERNRTNVSWDTHALCNSCAFVIGAYHIRDRYLPLEEVSTQQGWNLGFNYSLSHRSTISTMISGGESKFSDSTFGQDFKTQIARVAFLHQLNDQFNIGFHVSNEKRDSLSDADGESYSERYIGASISYDF